MAQQNRGRFRDLVARLFTRDEIIEPVRMDGEPSLSPISSYYRTRMELSSNRIKRYKDYRDMGEDTLISGALDMYADEAAQFDRQEGRTVWVVSNNKEVEKAIHTMLDATEMEEQIPGLARYLAQHGDNPVRPLADKNKGIVAMEFLEAEDFERQVDKYGRLTGFRILPLGDRSFDPWDIVHFRIMNRTQTVRQGGSIYGTSVLENARKTWRQLCLAKGTTIWTTAGPKSIEDVRAGDDVFCHDPDTGETAQTRIVAAKAMGRQKLVRVQTEHRELFVTPDHGLLAKTRGGEFVYKKAEDLVQSEGQAGKLFRDADQLVLPSLDGGVDHHVIKLNPKDYYVHLKEPAQYDSDGVVGRLSDLGLSTSLKNAHGFLAAKRGIRLDDFCKLRRAFFGGQHPDMVVTCGKSTRPTVASFGPANDRPFFVAGSDFVRLLGFMLGDGWVNEGGRIGFALGVDEKQNEAYRQLFEEMFHVEMATVPSKPGQGGQHYVGSIDIEKIFNAAGFVTGFANKVVPEWAYNLSPWLKVHLIRGIMDADGCEGDGRLTVANEQLARGVHTLCQQAGLRVSRKISTQDREDRQRSYRFWVEKIPLMDRWMPEAVVYERVTHVDPAGEGETYDLQVDDDLHNFVANGVVSHNTLLEDQLVIYRLEVGGRHRVFYIDVGTASHEQALAITRKYERQFGRKQYFNPQCLTADTKVFTLDGRQLRMDEMAAEVAAGKQQWVYSYDINKKKVVPGRVLWAGKTGAAVRVCRVQLDNDTSVMCTLDHRFLVKRDDGKRHEYVEASKLQPGDSITPVNFKLSDKGQGDLLSGYRMVWQDRFDNYQYVHRAVAHAAIGTPRRADGTFQPDYLVHHQDFNKLNNAPENLEWKTHQDHVDHHEKHSKNLELGRIRLQEILSGEEREEYLSRRERARQEAIAANPELRSRLAEASAATLRAWNKSDRAKVERKKSMTARWQVKPAEITDSLVRGKVNSVFAELKRRNLPITEEAWNSVARQGQISWVKAKTRYPEMFNFNHKVVSVTVGGKEDVFDIVVEQYHNFAVALENESGVFVHNSGEWTSRFTPLQLTSEIFWPIRGESASRIEYLGTDPNVQGIADLDYFRNKLFASLKIPKAYIGGDEYSSARYGLAQIDIAFARSVQRLQRALINGITRMGQIHLAFLGKDPTQAENQFQIMMSPPSTLDQEQRMEALDLSLTLSMKMKQIGEALGLDDQALNAYIQKTMLGLTPYDLSRITAQMPGAQQDQGFNPQVMDHLIRTVNGDPEAAGYRPRGERGDDIFPKLGDQGILAESLVGSYRSEADKLGFEEFFGETTEEEVMRLRSKMRVSDKATKD